MNKYVMSAASIITMCCAVSITNLLAQTQISASVYASYFGGSGEEYMVYDAVDRDGNVIIAGHTISTNLPMQSAYQDHKNGPSSEPDGFIAKFNPALNTTVFSTYLGGDGYDEIKDIAVDSAGNIYVTGITLSGNFPVTRNAFDTTLNSQGNTGSFDGFLTKLSPNGGLLYSTYIGGNDYDCPLTLSVIGSSVVCIAGMTSSQDFPLQSAYSDSLKGTGDIFVMKLDISTNVVVFSTFFGGSGNEQSFSMDMDVDASGSIYILGNTNSADLPMKKAFQPVYGGGDQDGFIAKFDENGGLIYSSYIGGNLYEGMGGIETNDRGEAYFIGSSGSSGLPCSSNAFLTDRGRNGMGIIIGKVGSSGDSLLYFSYFGGTYYDFADYGKIRCLAGDKIVIAGNTYYYPVSQNAFDRTAGNSEILVAVLDIARREVLYSTYLGGIGDDGEYDMSVLNDSTIYLSGTSSSTDFPVTGDAIYRNYAGGTSDAVFTRLVFRGLHPTGMRQERDGRPSRFMLEQNYPNPFNPSTIIQYTLGKPSDLQLSIYNLLGQKIKTLADEFHDAGEYSILWDATDDAGRPVSSGIYFYRLETGGQNLQKKMVLVR